MNLNCLVCSDCEKPMAVYELHDFYCSKTNLVIRLEERICLNCSATVLQVASLTPADSSNDVGRSESLEVTCASERPTKNLNKTFIQELIRIHFWEMVKNLCFLKTKCIWYRGFEIDLWETLHGDNKLKLMPEQINNLKAVSQNMNMWVINPSDWYGLENQDTPFVTVKTWQKLYAKRQEKFKTANELNGHSGKSS